MTCKRNCQGNGEDENSMVLNGFSTQQWMKDVEPLACKMMVVSINHS
jgi:hypothetical protein